MTITAEGLRIELTEGESGTFFELGSAVPSPSGVELLKALAQEVGKLPNKVSVEGHTDSKPYSGGLSGYSNWELSVDRANAARKIMQSSGLQGEPGCTGARICRSTAASQRRRRRSGEPENFTHRAIPGHNASGRRRGRRRARGRWRRGNHSAESKNGEARRIKYERNKAEP